MSIHKGSSISLQSAKKTTKKTRKTRLKPGASMKEEVVSRRLSSPLAEVYKSESFKKIWANDVRFHVAHNLVYLRRYRQVSQSQLGAAIGTSQSAIARIESGQENITLDTLERIVNGLDGRFFVSIHPAEYAPPQVRPWWEAILSAPWQVVGIVARSTAQTDQVIVGLERDRGISSSTLALGSTGLLAQSSTSSLMRS